MHGFYVSILACVSLLFALGMPALAADEPIQPIEYPTDLDEAKVELGKKLFFDSRLSKSGWISCNSCHNLSMGGADNLVSSIGHGWAEGPINAPTVLNSATRTRSPSRKGGLQALQGHRLHRLP